MTILRHARAGLRLAAFTSWSLLGYLLAALATPLRRIAPATHARLATTLCRAWARGVARILGLRIESSGAPPSPPFLLVCNHLGYLDIVVLMATAPGVFVARGDAAGWPLLGPLARVAGTIFVDRRTRRDVVRVNGLIRDVLDGGRGVIVFPEGTSSPGADVLPFRSSLLEPAVHLGRPVAYASLSYRTPPGSPPASHAVAWWGDMTFLDHFYGMLLLPAIFATLEFGPECLHGTDRHELAETLFQAVRRQFKPTPDPEARWA